MLIDDPSIYLADFGVTIVAGAVTGLGILDMPSEILLDNQIVSTDYTVTCEAAKFGGLLYGSQVTVNGAAYEVRTAVLLTDGVFVQLSLQRSTEMPYYSPAEADLVRGQVSRMTTGTIDIVTQGVYVSTGLTGTFDTATAIGMTLGTANAFAVKNTSGATKLMQFYGSIDAATVSGNNKLLGIKLGKNSIAIDATECRAFTGSGAHEAKLVTNWMISMDPTDEVALLIANHSGTEDITFGRGRLVATEVR